MEQREKTPSFLCIIFLVFSACCTDVFFNPTDTPASALCIVLPALTCAPTLILSRPSLLNSCLPPAALLSVVCGVFWCALLYLFNQTVAGHVQVELLQNLDPGVGVKDDHPAGVASAYKYLVQRYKDFGKMQAEAGRVDEAIALWDKCADAARGCADKSSEGSSYYQLGLLNNQSQRPEAALPPATVDV